MYDGGDLFSTDIVFEDKPPVPTAAGIYIFFFNSSLNLLLLNATVYEPDDMKGCINFLQYIFAWIVREFVSQKLDPYIYMHEIQSNMDSRVTKYIAGIQNNRSLQSAYYFIDFSSEPSFVTIQKFKIDTEASCNSRSHH